MIQSLTYVTVVKYKPLKQGIQHQYDYNILRHLFKNASGGNSFDKLMFFLTHHCR